MQLRDRTVVVLGNPYGIGAAISHLFTRHGANVRCLGDFENSPANGSQALASLNTPTYFDVCDADSVESIAWQYEREGVFIDVLINLPGRALFGSFEQTDVKIWREAIDRNLTSIFLCSKAFLPLMKHRSGGVIINHGSIDGLLGNPSLSAYSAAKGGVVSLTHVMAHDLAKYGIRVNCISTGGIRDGETRPKDAGLVALTPSGRTGTPMDVAHVALFLASDAAAYVNGANIVVDGGRTTITQGCYGDPHVS